MVRNNKKCTQTQNSKIGSPTHKFSARLRYKIIMTINNNNMIATCAVMMLVLGGASGFSVHHHGATTGAPTTSQLMMSSRRDILSNAASFAAVGLSALVLGPNDAEAFGRPITPQSAANKAAESYQGVYTDPNHPEGYRVIMASAKGATMELSDGVAKGSPEGTEAKTYKKIPVANKGGSNEFVFDLSFSEYHIIL